MKNIFQKIIDGEAPADIVYQDDSFIVIKDIHPKAPIHLLIIPKKAIVSIQEIKEADLPLIGKAMKIAQELAKKFHLDTSGYRILTNHGADSGQIVPHLHFHLLGGSHLGRIAG